MPNIKDIQSAFVLQQQLAQIQQAIISLRDGGALMNVSVSSQPPVTVMLSPPLDKMTNPTAVEAIIDMLSHQGHIVSTALQEMGYDDTGDPGPVGPMPPITIPTPPPPMQLPPMLPNVAPAPEPVQPTPRPESDQRDGDIPEIAEPSPAPLPPDPGPKPDPGPPV